MTNREKALQLANDAIERIEAGSIMPDTQDLMAYALILVLAEICEQLRILTDHITYEAQ
jgi:hypothetical protein